MLGKGALHLPLMQGFDWHSSISTSQVKPLKPGLHWHCHKLADGWIQAPFLHGFDKQTSICTSHRYPVKPGGHVHV